MLLQDANDALDAAMSAVKDAANAVLVEAITHIAQDRPGATLRVTPDTYEYASLDIDVVGGGPVTPLYKFIDSDDYRIVELAAMALVGAIDTGARAGVAQTIQPR